MFRFNRKSKSQRDVSVTLQPPCLCPSVTAPYKALEMWVTNLNNAGIKKSRDLSRGEVFYTAIIFYVTDS